MAKKAVRACRLGIFRLVMQSIFSAAVVGLSLALAQGGVQARESQIFTPSNTPPPPPGVSTPATPRTAPVPVPAAASTSAAVAATPTALAATAPQAAPAARPPPRPSRSRDRVVRMLAPLKICNVQVNAPKGEMRTAELAACIKR